MDHVDLALRGRRDRAPSFSRLRSSQLNSIEVADPHDPGDQVGPAEHDVEQLVGSHGVAEYRQGSRRRGTGSGTMKRTMQRALTRTVTRTMTAPRPPRARRDRRYSQGWGAGLAGLGACGGPAAAPAGARAAGRGRGGAGAPAVTAPVAAPDPALAPLPLWPEVRARRLPNGLTYYLMKNKKPEGRVLLWLAVNAGLGAGGRRPARARRTSSSTWRSTAPRGSPSARSSTTSSTRGMRFGADLNAYTSYDETVYTLEVPADDPAHLDRGLDILRDWAGAVALRSEGDRSRARRGARGVAAGARRGAAAARTSTRRRCTGHALRRAPADRAAGDREGRAAGERWSATTATGTGRSTWR